MREPAQNMAEPRVCVIIPTLRNAQELETALDGLSQQTWNGPLEVAIVGPTGDPGKEVAETKGMTWIDDQGSRTRADACNIALATVDCDLVLFTDDDVWVPEDWVEKLVRWFEQDDVAGVGGPNLSHFVQSGLLPEQIMEIVGQRH